MRLLVIEDDSRMSATLADILHGAGYQVDIAADGSSGLDNAMSRIYDLVILDYMLPKMNGLQVLDELRQAKNHVPVLMLTVRSGIADRVSGLNRGADYFLTKPFSPEELTACVRALLRRPHTVMPEEIVFSDVSLNTQTCVLSCGDRSISLSAREMTLFGVLIRNPERIVPKETLIMKGWGYDSDAGDNNLEAFISLLRKKLKHIHSGVSIRNERLLGYRLEAAPCSKD